VGVAAGLTTLPQLSGGVPKGYLRLLVFNADSALVGQQVQQLSSAALGNYERLRLRVLVPQDGYVTAFVGNESDVDVFFDDVTVELRQGLQVQETQYDPTGLELAGLTGTTPGLKALSQYKFNGKEFQTDLGLNWNHQDWRFFDTQLGRWHVVDPEIENAQESWTPYSFGFDNAIRFADANGRNPGDPPTGGPSVAGILYNTVVGIGVSLANASVMSMPGVDLLTTVTNGGTFRASVGENGDVSYGIRPTATTLGGMAANGVADALDMASAAATVMTAGGAGVASRALPMGAGLLLEQGGAKIAQNAVVQEGKTLLRGANRITNANSKASNKLNTLYELSSEDGKYLKTGITSKAKPENRYTKEFMSDKKMKILDQGSRGDMLKKERHIVEHNPGPLNFEPWAGSKKSN
jgi:RHS repeat-associated protein